MRRWLLAGSLVLLPSLDAFAQGSVQEVSDCMKRNIPKHSSSQTLHFASKDGIGGPRECKAKVLGTRQEDGLRHLKVCMEKPEDVRGMKLLLREVEGRAPDTRLYLPGQARSKPITGDSQSRRVCNSDVSYEDLDRQQQLNRAESLERLADAKVDGRAVYVLQSRPKDPAQSAYTKVVNYVDKATCIVVRSESFESGKKPRKVMEAKPDDLLEEEGIRVPAEITVTDLRRETKTTVTADDLEVDDAVDERSFQTSWLDGKQCR